MTTPILQAIANARNPADIQAIATQFLRGETEKELNAPIVDIEAVEGSIMNIHSLLARVTDAANNIYMEHDLSVNSLIYYIRKAQEQLQFIQAEATDKLEQSKRK